MTATSIRRAAPVVQGQFSQYTPGRWTRTSSPPKGTNVLSEWLAPWSAWTDIPEPPGRPRSYGGSRSGRRAAGDHRLGSPALAERASSFRNDDHGWQQSRWGELGCGAVAGERAVGQGERLGALRRHVRRKCWRVLAAEAAGEAHDIDELALLVAQHLLHVAAEPQCGFRRVGCGISWYVDRGDSVCRVDHRWVGVGEQFDQVKQRTDVR